MILYADRGRQWLLGALQRSELQPQAQERALFNQCVLASWREIDPGLQIEPGAQARHGRKRNLMRPEIIVRRSRIAFGKDIEALDQNLRVRPDFQPSRQVDGNLVGTRAYDPALADFAIEEAGHTEQHEIGAIEQAQFDLSAGCPLRRSLRYRDARVRPSMYLL